jgi:hypothetical protein
VSKETYYGVKRDLEKAQVELCVAKAHVGKLAQRFAVGVILVASERHLVHDTHVTAILDEAGLLYNTHTHTHTHTHTCVCIHVCMYVFMYVHVCMYVYVCVCV